MSALRATDGDEAEAWLTDLWHAHSARVLAYASRHIDRYAAQEIVAETFLVAWRRRADVPDEPLPWLLVVARNQISNQVRSAARRRSIEEELARVAALTSGQGGPDVSASERDAVMAGLRALSADDREVLLLAGWDGLDAREAAMVLGVREGAYRARLSRARRRFERAAEADVDDEPRKLPKSLRRLP